MTVTVIVILACIGGLAFFLLLWCGICLLLAAIGGWEGLAKRYATTAAPRGVRHGMASARIGAVNYNSALTIHIAEDGMFLSVIALLKLGHAPLFIPWSAVRERKEHSLFGRRSIELVIGEPRITSITLAQTLLEGAPR